MKKLSLNKYAISRLNALYIKGAGPISPGTDSDGPIFLTDDGETCDPRNSACECNTNFNCD